MYSVANTLYLLEMITRLMRHCNWNSTPTWVGIIVKRSECVKLCLFLTCWD